MALASLCLHSFVHLYIWQIFTECLLLHCWEYRSGQNIVPTPCVPNILTEEKDIKYKVIQCQVVLNIMTKEQGNMIESDGGVYFR